MMMRNGIAVAALAFGLLAAPALADVKTGVDAWSRGDYRKAIEEWRAPAVAGDADAQFNLGQAYKLGRGVPKDLAMAEEWYRKAAQQGHPQAADNYGLALFENGRRDQAVPWLEKSATRGEPRAQYVLGTMLFNGDVVKRDWVRAYALMTRASGAGLEQASTSLAQMDKYVSLTDRQRGTELARRYEAEAGRPITAEVTSAPAVPRPARPVASTPVPPSDVGTVQPEVIDTRPVRRPPAARPVPVAQAPVERPQPVASGAWRAQLGAFRDPDGARRMWSQLSGRFPGRQPYYVKAGALTRLLVGPFASQAEAARGCGSVKPCVPTR
ncbi:MAG: SPOR domain-containing protein [Pseudomonadota bacterium]